MTGGAVTACGSTTDNSSSASHVFTVAAIAAVAFTATKTLRQGTHAVSAVVTGHCVHFFSAVFVGCDVLRLLELRRLAIVIQGLSPHWLWRALLIVAGAAADTWFLVISLREFDAAVAPRRLVRQTRQPGIRCSAQPR